VRLIKMLEPPGVQLQELLEKPFGRQTVTRGGTYENGIVAEAFWQMRILDLEQCVTALPVPRSEPLRFVLELEDPIADYLPKSDWRGTGGEYTVTLGPEPAVETAAGKGNAENLPMMKAGIAAFSRLVFGVLPASMLAVTDHLEAPAQLIDELDDAIRLPVPHFDWLF
jgi:predicted acetyltransferase